MRLNASAADVANVLLVKVKLTWKVRKQSNTVSSNDFSKTARESKWSWCKNVLQKSSDFYEENISYLISYLWIDLKVKISWEQLLQSAEKINTTFGKQLINRSSFQRASTIAAMCNPRAACGPVEGFVWLSLGFRCCLHDWQPVLISII